MSFPGIRNELASVVEAFLVDADHFFRFFPQDDPVKRIDDACRI
jgi:hypothetical protein